MNPCKTVVAVFVALLGLAGSAAGAKESASMRVGITIVTGCETRLRETGTAPGSAILTTCSRPTPHHTAIAPAPRLTGLDGDPASPADHGQGIRVVTVTF